MRARTTLPTLAALAALAAPPALAEGFGLDALLGVAPGMPVDEAVAALVARGFAVDERAADKLAANPPEQGDGPPLALAATPALGLVTTTVTLDTPWGLRDVAARQAVSLIRQEGGASVKVQLDSAVTPATAGAPPGYGTGPVYAVVAYQDFGQVEQLVGWLQIEARLRAKAGVAPTCEDFADGVSLLWELEAGVVQPPEGEACGAAAYGAIAAAAPDRVAAEVIAGTAVLPAEPVGSLEVVLSPSAGAGWIWMRRMDATLGRRLMGEAMSRALTVPPGVFSAAEF